MLQIKSESNNQDESNMTTIKLSLKVKIIPTPPRQ